MSINELDVFDALSTTVWKKTLQIKDEIEDKKGARINYGRLHNYLDAFTAAGVAEVIYGEPESAAESLARGSRGIAKYRLTQDGVRRRHELQQDSVPDFTGHNVPVLA